jgi:UDPglucose 6-dehydrogenase
MRIAMIGTGSVGLVSGTCFAEFGINVTGLDNDATKVDKLHQGIMPIYEPGLDVLVERQTKSGRLTFTTDLAQGVAGAEAIFIAVGTPARSEDGHADLTYVYQAARELAPLLKNYTVIVTKSTVPVGTAREVEKIIRETNPDADFDVASNPEFLREGAAIDDFMRPDRVVIGTDSERAQEVLRDVYRPLYINETPIIMVGPETSELIKYASNAFLATKITFINEIADLCEKTGADVQKVSKAMGLDGRIGGKFLHAGPGYGGSCFPKDTLALAQIGQTHGAPQSIVEQVIQVNQDRQRAVGERIIAAFDGDIKGKTIGILGISFKPNTDDVRDAPSLVIVPMLQEAGAIVKAYDPAAREQAEKHLKNVAWQEDAYAVADDADALVILTEWNEFRALSLATLKEKLNQPLLLDFRNIYTEKEIISNGYRYISIGRKEINATQGSASLNVTLKEVG